MDPAITTLCVLAVAAFLFVTELIPLHRRTFRWYVRYRRRYV